ncbi:hypothetical protein [Mycoplana rhizolycopersici]|uniref:Uncharacterized protein n=1 Tax=Mycoplana rhizolycopersici TaxID=2746702 RepID=A0ABX2QJU3_9HYPH|nr:hypothetical protein [Rhizobium rhizolycopersici]NVP57167.1 hypothetical protein [Rhizobium rhizolycopersici]
MTRMLAMLLMSTAVAAPALAASITNNDAEAVVLTIVENGSRSELAVGAGQTETVCPSGCFVTLPNGDRVALHGDETVEISGGAAVIK